MHYCRKVFLENDEWYPLLYEKKWQKKLGIAFFKTDAKNKFLDKINDNDDARQKWITGWLTSILFYLEIGIILVANHTDNSY